MSILTWIVVGLVAGLIARALIPGKQHMGLVSTALLGLAGSLLGGFAGMLVGGERDFAAFTPSGLIGSILGAIALLLIAGFVFTRRTRVRAPA